MNSNLKLLSSLGLVGLLTISSAFAQDQRTPQLSSSYHFEVNTAFPPQTECEKTLSMMDEFLKLDCFQSLNSGCSALRSAMKTEFLFDLSGTVHAYEFFKSYSINDQGASITPRGLYGWDFSKRYLERSYSTSLDQYVWKMKTELPVEKILESLKMTELFSMKKSSATENSLIIHNKLIACLFDSKKITFQASGELELYGYHPMEYDREKVLGSLFVHFNEIKNKKISNEKKYFLAGIAAAKAYQKITNYRNENREKQYEESALSTLNVLLDRKTDEFSPLFQDMETMKKNLFSYPTEKHHVQLQISN